jgi:hypothetical protein
MSGIMAAVLDFGIAKFGQLRSFKVPILRFLDILLVSPFRIVDRLITYGSERVNRILQEIDPHILADPLG